MSVGEYNILLTGDIEKEAQGLLIEREKQLQTDVLIAPHHGSKTSLSTAWINKTRPNYVIFSTGYQNMYHLPNSSVVNAYRKVNAKIYNTAISGAIRFELTPKGSVSIEAARQQKKFYWQYLKIN